jgi:hypothetical protein
MSETPPFDIELLLPKSSQGAYIAKRAYLLKVGYVGVSPLADLGILRGTRDQLNVVHLRESRGQLKVFLREFVKVLYDAFEKSPSVLEIRPRRDTSDELTSNCTFVVEKEGDAFHSFGGCIELRVALSEQLQREYGVLTAAPEQLCIAYDGRLFLAWCEVARIQPLYSVGQGAREFLKATAGAQDSIKLLDSGGPTPIHPNIYLVAVEHKDGTPLPEKLIDSFGVRNRDLMVLYPAEIPIGAAVRQFRNAVWSTLHVFYDARSTSWSINDTLTKIDELNDQLSGCLVEMFGRSAITAMVSGIPRRIRRLLSQLHMQFQALSRDEIHLRESIDQMNSSIERHALVKPLHRYLKEEAGDHDAIDKDTQLRFMDYAGSEATNVSVIQATLWAAIIGALVGALTTLLLSHWLGGST